MYMYLDGALTVRYMVRVVHMCMYPASGISISPSILQHCNGVLDLPLRQEAPGDHLCPPLLAQHHAYQEPLQG